MVKEWIDGATLRDMILAGAVQLENNKSYVDSLNVFPVPDGDTGSNMSMTMQGAAKEVQALPETATAEKVFLAASRGALRNARGNSGVILSQIFRGFAKASKGLENLDAPTLARAFQEGTDAAYKAVLKPKEGTILTVSRIIGEKANKAVEQNPDITCLELASLVMKEGETALKSTPDLLPVLKEAGVVDSGGQGLMFIYAGFYSALSGEAVQLSGPVNEEKEESELEKDMDSDVLLPESIEFGYCTEFFIVHLIEGFDEKDLDTFRLHLLRVGDSVVLVSDGDTVKVHVHSNCPGKILQMALTYGELDRLKIENMREQNRQLLEARKKNRTEYAMVAVSTGEGIDGIFKDLNVKQIIAGGQTMNPSIDTIASAVRKANANTVYVLPNNSNIVLAATQAAELCDCDVRVIPTKTIPQGLYAAMAFNPMGSPEENEKCMLEAAGTVVSGSITYAVRETSINGKEIHEGDIIGLVNGDIAAVTSNVKDTAKELLKTMIEKADDEEASVSLYYGNDYAKEDADALASELEEMYPDADFTVHYGGQPLYYLYFSVM